MAEIPRVDLFVAGTSCVDFSSLNSRKAAEFVGIREANNRFKDQFANDHNLTWADLDPEDWRRVLESLNTARSENRKSTVTFAGAANYLRLFQPKVAIFENVMSAPWASTTQYVFPLLGYAAVYVDLDTKDYALPQTRLRKYVAAFNHGFFGLEGAKALCKLFPAAVKALERRYSSSITDFLLPINSTELHRARNETELASQSSKQRDVDWSFSKGRHTNFRRDHELPDERRWLRWRETGCANLPAKMWKPWILGQTCRVWDLLECARTMAIHGRNPKHAAYDPIYKAQIIDASQNVDRVNLGVPFGATGCLTPNAIPVLSLEARPVTGSESLKLQGLPIENFNMSIETQSQLQDLAGNAMSTTVVGATMLAAFGIIANYARENNLDWLQHIFPKRDYTEDDLKDRNSFKHDPLADMGDHLLVSLDELVLSSYYLSNGAVTAILELANKTRRRCVCFHILAYSSMDLYVCIDCGASYCKSCKGNPDHRLVKSIKSFEDIGCLSYADGEDQIRQFFPSVLPLLTKMSESVSGYLRNLLIQSYQDEDGDILLDAIRSGLCDSIYQLAFIEVTDATRIEYVSKNNFILRVILEEDQIIWNFHLDQWSKSGKAFATKNRASHPIARAAISRDASTHFPTAWEIWHPKKVTFNLFFELGMNGDLLVLPMPALHDIPLELRSVVGALQGRQWAYCPECGFPEDALWVSKDGPEKLYLFKDVDPVGPSNRDQFVITAINREMGRTPQAEVRPVLLRINAEYQIHHMMKDLSPGQQFCVGAAIDGWWVSPETQGAPIPTAEIPRVLADLTPDVIQRFPANPPAAYRQFSDDQTLKVHGTTQLPCDRDQVLLSMSLPVFGTSAAEVDVLVKTLRDLDLTKQLDFAEFARLIGPGFYAFEKALITALQGKVLLLHDISLDEDCADCAPKMPEVQFVRRDRASVKYGKADAMYPVGRQMIYNKHLSRQPITFRIDHSVDPAAVPHTRKQDGFKYVDIRFVGRPHTLMQQARSYMPEHPSYHNDDCSTRATFALQVSVLENPRPSLESISIRAPKSIKELGRHVPQPQGFNKDQALFDEQRASLEWMLSRENNHSEIKFTEREFAEVYVEHLHLRVVSESARSIIRRGRVVADSVGFGKTAVSLGLIDRQHKLDREDFLKMRQENPTLQNGYVHLKATLVIVPNQLTEQWRNEAKLFLKADYTIVLIQSFGDLEKYDILEKLEKADIIICSNKIFQEPGYMSQLRHLCDPARLSDTYLTEPRIYRAWYKRLLQCLSCFRGQIMEFLRGKSDHTQKDLLDALRKDVMSKSHAKDQDDGVELLETDTSTSGMLDFFPLENLSTWVPKVLLEFFTFARVIWDEFPYENIPVTEFVANCPTVAKWMLSGTPPLNTLGEVARIAYLFNVHLARPLALVKGRQPPVCENPPMTPLSSLEQADLYQSRNSPSMLQERHRQLLEFVGRFIRKNARAMKEVKSVERPLVLSSTTDSYIAYRELEQELIANAYNANLLSSEPRRRLLSRLDWKIKAPGVVRSVDGLVLRASSSSRDVQECSLGVGVVSKSSAQIALLNHEKALQTVNALVDRCRELFGKAINLGYRMAYIGVSTHTSKIDNGEKRQLSYFATLDSLFDGILNVNVDRYGGWDGYLSALRALLWDYDLDQRLQARDLDGLPPMDDTEAWKAKIHSLWDGMHFGESLKLAPIAPETGREAVLAQKKELLVKFDTLLTRTPLHSRRWFLVDELEQEKMDLPPVKRLLAMEIMYKLPYETEFRNAEPTTTSDLVPICFIRKAIREMTQMADGSLSRSDDDLQVDLDALKTLDEARRAAYSLPPSQDMIAAIDQRIKTRIKNATGKIPKLAKVDYVDEATLRGLVSKSTDKKHDLQHRLALDDEGKATDDCYRMPEGCPLKLEPFPLEGKQTIRASKMEVVFNLLMHTIDALSKTLESLPAATAKANLQGTIFKVLSDQQICDQHPGSEAKDTHSVCFTCGHVHCFGEDRNLAGVLCGVHSCTSPLEGACIPLCKLTQPARIIDHQDLPAGALLSRPKPYEDIGKLWNPKNPVLVSHKAAALISLVGSMHENDQVVVFVQNPSIMMDVYDALKNADISHVSQTLLGGARESKALEDFKSGGKRVLVQLMNSEQAAGSNLHTANHVVFVSPLITCSQAAWDAQMQQALGRCVRFRQKKTVFVYHMVMDETIEVDALEFRKKSEILVEADVAVGRFHDTTAPEFLDRFDAGEKYEEKNARRVISRLKRDDVQFLMGDNFMSRTAARSSKTMDGAAQEKKTEEIDVQGA